MMIKFKYGFVAFSALLLSSVFSLFSQQKAHSYLDTRGEVYLQVTINNKNDISILNQITSVDSYNDTSAIVNANTKEFYSLLKHHFNYKVLVPPSINVNMDNPFKGTDNWNAYPTYNEYVSMMYQYESDYPQLCKIYDIGKSVNGRSILFAKLTDNLNERENEPLCLYTSTMHGDETTGYILLLRLIDYLLDGYDSIPRIKKLLDSTEIWINPLANPDGTYFTDDSTISGAIRRNANGVDLNRNFPDPVAGQHPDGCAWQPENTAMMNFMKSRQVVLSANFHGGVMVINYPWDTWAHGHADSLWYVNISRKYADTAQFYSPDGYMDAFNNGITNGYAWYRITGGRQDYTNYFAHAREVTVELSDIKTPDPIELPDYWNYNYRSLIGYLENSFYGICGVVQDSITQEPLKASVSITGYDTDNSEVYTDTANGYFHRLILPGNYDLYVEANGYHPKKLNGISIQEEEKKYFTVLLKEDTTKSEKQSVEIQQSLITVYPNPCKTFIKISLPEVIELNSTTGIEVVSQQGTILINKKFIRKEKVYVDMAKLPNGVYYLKIKNSNNTWYKKVVKAQ